MNLTIKSFIAVAALSAAVFAAEPAPAAASAAEAPAAPAAEAPAAVAAEAPATPAAEAPAAPAEAPAAAAAEAPAETSAAPVAAAPAEDAAAPVAVRDGAAPAPAAEPATEPAAAEPVAAPAPTETKTVTKIIYQPVYTSEPTAVRSSEYVPVQTVYVAQTNGKDTVTFDELRGLVPVKHLLGVQASIGSYIVSADDRDYYYNYDFDSYYGLTWRAGVFTILPLTEYTVGLRLGVLFEQSDASATETYASTSVKAKFKQRKIDIPVLFAFKSPRSSFMFEIGTQASLPIQDEFKVTFDDESSKIDMIDKDYRRSVDWDLVFGFGVMANKYIGLDFQINAGISNLYDCSEKDYDMFNLNSLGTASFLIGLSAYIF